MNRFIRVVLIGALLAAFASYWHGAAFAAPKAEKITDARAFLTQAWDRALHQTQSAKSKFSLHLESSVLDAAINGEAAVCGLPDYTAKVAGRYTVYPIFYGGPFEREIEAYMIRGASDWTTYQKLYTGKWRRETGKFLGKTSNLMWGFTYGGDPEGLAGLIEWGGAIVSSQMGDVRIARQDDRTATFRVALDMQSLRDMAIEDALAPMDKSPGSERTRQWMLAVIHRMFDRMEDIHYNVEVDKQSGRITRFYADLTAPARAVFITLIEEAAAKSNKDREFLELISRDAKLLISVDFYSINQVEPFEVPREIVEQAAKKHSMA